jgi:catechol 2,3-dioxygenase-like lactoylglutathione lyase family enzyme
MSAGLLVNIDVDDLESATHFYCDALGVRVALKRGIQLQIVRDGSGDSLDAAICAAQAAWAAARPRYGMPLRRRAAEGWIVSA